MHQPIQAPKAGQSPNSQKTRSPGYEPGNHWVECERCAFVYRQAQMRTEWTGLHVCKACWEPRHPQDFVRGRGDDPSAKGIVNPESAETFVSVTFADDGHTAPTGTNNNSL